MSPTLEHTRNKFENNLIEMMITTTGSQDNINKLIQDWIELRTIDLKTKPEYKALLNTPYEGMLLDKFKSQVVNELGLDNPDTDLGNYFKYNPLSSKDKNAYSNDIANKNNLNHVMQDALGYDNLTERLQDSDKSGELAQSNIFEKELAKYYIDKRKDYKASKELLEKLDKYFGNSSSTGVEGLPDPNSIGYDLEASLKNKGISTNTTNLNRHHFFLNTFQEKPLMFPEDQLKLTKLGDSTHIAIYGKNNGVAEELLKYDSEHNTWPEMLPKFDYRRTTKQWVEEKLDEILREIFEGRSKIETNMSRNELRAYDQNFAHLFNKDNMIKRLFDKVDEEYAELLLRRASHESKENTEMDDGFKKRKHYNIQRDFNRKIKNMDAAYKLITYRYFKDKDPNLPETAFVNFYDKQLQRDIHEAPKTINPIDYETKDEMFLNPTYFGDKVEHRNMEEKSNKYYEDYQGLKQGVLEESERQEAYFILEKYRERTDLDDKAKQSLENYFSNYENISFFEINKIK